jgi:hypothetical protein
MSWKGGCSRGKGLNGGRERSQHDTDDDDGTSERSWEEIHSVVERVNENNNNGTLWARCGSGSLLRRGRNANTMSLSAQNRKIDAASSR